MQDSFDDYLVTEQRVLSEVDEYSAYCFYLGYEPELRKAYHCPYRKDDKPSFSLFNSRKGASVQYMWKDSGDGRAGTLFTLVGLLFGIQGEDILRKIDEDFGLEYYEDSKPLILKPPLVPPPTEKTAAHIRVRYKKFNEEATVYWKQYIDNLQLLNTYNVRFVEAFWTREEQLYPTIPKTLTFSYRIDNHFKVYQPFNSDYKFINNFDESEIEGWEQLSATGDLLIITKSTKDVMVLRDLGYDAIAPRGESILIPPHKLRELEQRFKRIIILFDNDGKHKASSYPYKSVEVPLSTGAKDVSDYRAMYGRDKTLQLLNDLVWNGMK